MTQCCCPCFQLLRSWILETISGFRFSASLNASLKRQFLNILLREEVKCRRIICDLLCYEIGPHPQEYHSLVRPIGIYILGKVHPHM